MINKYEVLEKVNKLIKELNLNYTVYEPEEKHGINFITVDTKTNELDGKILSQFLEFGDKVVIEINFDGNIDILYYLEVW